MRTRTNRAGGMLGGISTGEEIVVKVAVKPTSSVAQDQETVDWNLQPRTIKVEGRHDPSVVPRAVPVAVIDQDHSALSRTIQRLALANPRIEVKAVASDERAAQAAMRPWVEHARALAAARAALAALAAG